MTDDRELAGLDPFALLDTEAGRLDAFLSGLSDSGWNRASRCAGWTVRDVLGHLAASEDYHRACLDGTVAAFLAGFAERGGTDLDSVNALGVADYAASSPAQVLTRWRAASADALRAPVGDALTRRSAADRSHVTRPRSLIRRTWCDTRLRSHPIWAASTVICIRPPSATLSAVSTS
jgi:uncharacterized protein (TIGR03083 family)